MRLNQCQWWCISVSTDPLRLLVMWWWRSLPIHLLRGLRCSCYFLQTIKGYARWPCVGAVDEANICRPCSHIDYDSQSATKSIVEVRFYSYEVSDVHVISLTISWVQCESLGLLHSLEPLLPSHVLRLGLTVLWTPRCVGWRSVLSNLRLSLFFSVVIGFFGDGGWGNSTIRDHSHCGTTEPTL